MNTKKITSIILFLLFNTGAYSNVSEYTFSQSTNTFNSIHTTGTYIAAGCTSSVFGNLPIGFTFVYNGSSYTQFGLCCSGWISMGPSSPMTSIYPLSSGTTNNVIAPFAAQLTSNVAGDGIYYKTEGTAPNRVLTVEWWQYGFWLNGFDEICFQIKLYETTNQVKFVYITNDELSIRNIQVGLRGSSNADFNNRQTTTNWSQTSGGTSNTAYCLFSPGITPPAGLTFIFTPPPVGIIRTGNEIPENFELHQNYPNPFNPSTSIQFDVPVKTFIRLTVYDALGHEAAVLVNEELLPGTYESDFDGTNLASGVYYYKFTAGEINYTKKMVLIK
jgi:hypothetical protein